MNGNLIIDDQNGTSLTAYSAGPCHRQRQRVDQVRVAGSEVTCRGQHRTRLFGDPQAAIDRGDEGIRADRFRQHAVEVGYTKSTRVGARNHDDRDVGGLGARGEFALDVVSSEPRECQIETMRWGRLKGILPPEAQ